MNQVFFSIFLLITGIAVGLPFKKQIPFSFICVSSYLWGSLFWVLAACILLIFNQYTSTAIFLLIVIIIILSLIISYRVRALQFSLIEIFLFFSILLVVMVIAITTAIYNFSTTTIDGAGRILIGKSLFWDGFTSYNLSQLGHNGIFTEALQSAAAVFGDAYLYTVQPLFALSLIGIFIFLAIEVFQEINTGNLYIHRIIVAVLFMYSTYFMVFQAFYIHDNFVTGIFTLTSIISFWLAHQQQRAGWLFFGSLATIGISLARVEGPVFALIILVLSLSQDQFPYRNRLWTYLIPAIIISSWYTIILTVVNQDVYFLKTDRVILVIGAYLGLALLTILSKYKWVRNLVFPRIHIFSVFGVLIILTGLIIFRPEHIWTNISMIISNMYTNGRWGSFWYFILPLLFFSIPLPKFSQERFITINLFSFFILLVALGGLRNPYRLGWSDSANRMLVHIVPTLVFYLVLKYTSSWKLSKEQIHTIIGDKNFISFLAIPSVLIFIGCFFWFTKPLNYALDAKAIQGADEFTENHPFSSALREDKNSKYAETQSGGDFNVIIDLQKLVHANIIELSVKSDSTDASAQRMLSDIGWAVSSDNSNWTVIYQPPSTNMNNVRLVHNSRFQYPVGQVESFRYVRMTFKPVNPEERLKIKKINIWSHSPDGYYPDK